MYQDNSSGIPGTVKLLIATAVLGMLSIVGYTILFENNPAGYTMVVQAPVSGDLSVHSSPGVVWTGFGSVTMYKQVPTISFGNENSTLESGQAGPVSVRFNDNGTATVYGNARFVLPTDKELMIGIHKRHRSYEHLIEQLLIKHTASTLVTSAAMFSAENIYGGGKAEYERITQDQLENGKYQTEVTEVETVDPLTNDKHRNKKVSIKVDENNHPIRLKNPLSEYGIKVDQFLMDKDFQYEEGVLKQMSTQREAFQSTVTARAQAQRAQQDVITAKAEGEAAVTKAEYEKLVEQKREVVDAEKRKMVAITEAEARRQVAELEKQAAEQTKLAQIALGEGESKRKQLVMAADGALEQKLIAYIQVNAKYAEALGQYKGNWVPQVMMGAQGAAQSQTGNSPVNDLINMFMVQSAKNLAIDMTMNNGSKTAER